MVEEMKQLKAEFNKLKADTDIELKRIEYVKSKALEGTIKKAIQETHKDQEKIDLLRKIYGSIILFGVIGIIFQLFIIYIICFTTPI